MLTGPYIRLVRIVRMQQRMLETKCDDFRPSLDTVFDVTNNAARPIRWV